MLPAVGSIHDPLSPAPALMRKLGEVVLRADRYISPAGGMVDLGLLGNLLADAEVREWIKRFSAAKAVEVERENAERSPSKGNSRAPRPMDTGGGTSRAAISRQLSAVSKGLR